MSKQVALLLLLVIAFWLAEDTAMAQCAVCRVALEQSAEGRALAGSFRYGILLLLVAPYLICGTAGVVFFRAYRKKAAARRAKDFFIP